MTSWYYVRNDEQIGPFSESQMADLIAAGTIRSETLVWSAGMASWTPARDARLTAATPAAGAVAHGSSAVPFATEVSAPSSASEAAPETLRASIHPWRRWLARLLDVGLFAVVAGIVSEILLPGAFLNWSTWLVNFVMLVMWQPLEALLLSTVGTTPGKALLGMSVEHQSGIRLSYWTALKRSALVWIRGLGLGVPMVTIFTMALSYDALRNDGRAPWDVLLETGVRHRDLSAARWIAVIAAIALYVALTIYGTLPA